MSGVLDRFEVKSYNRTNTVCDARVDGRTVLITERPDNPGPSVTNNCERVVTELAAELNVDPRDVEWFEHYPHDPPTLDRIELEQVDVSQPVCFRRTMCVVVKVRWRPPTPEERERVRQLWPFLGIESDADRVMNKMAEIELDGGAEL